MKVVCHFRHMPYAESLKEQAIEKLHKLDKYSLDARTLHLYFSVDGHKKTLEAHLTNSHRTYKASGRAEDFVFVIDQVVSKLSRQIQKQKQKRRLHKHHNEASKQAKADLAQAVLVDKEFADAG